MQTLSKAAKFEQARWELLKQRIADRADTVPPAPCPTCGHAICLCRCPKCSICGGSGYVRRSDTDDVTDPNFGKIDQCPNYSRTIILADAQAGKELGGLAAEEVLQLQWSMVKPGYSDGVKAREAVKRAYECGSGLVLLFGTFGQAKTLTMKIAVATALRDGKRARYAKLTNVLDDIRMAYDSKENMQGELLRRIEAWRELDVLALDEMDKAAKNSDWAMDRIFNLLDDRYMLAVREKSLTITAGNWMNLDDLNSAFAYFRSRIEDNRVGTVVYLNGPDGRRVMPKGNHF